MNADQIAIIPQPVKLIVLGGEFQINTSTQIIAEQTLSAQAQYLQTLLASWFGTKNPINNTMNPSIHNFVYLCLDKTKSSLGKEGYRFESTETGISILAFEPNGIFYGIQTLRQLLPFEIENQPSSTSPNDKSIRIPILQIEDYPRFPWRGYMLDDGRYFHGTAVVKKVLDLLALHKMNRFHWHLTEDQGWRIEIKKYPKLTEIGSKRKQTQIGGFFSKKRDGQPHEGFYTQTEIKEIVAYAAERFITIIPEIEMPGHAQAAIAAYPEFSCTGGPFEVSDHFGIHKDVFCPGKEGTYQFYQDVIDEVVALFPSEIIHIGGDETPKTRWKQCPDCQRRIQEEKLSDESQLQVYFTNRMEKYLATKGKRLMGWNEILGKGLSPKAIAQYWTGPPSRILPDLQQGREMVMSAFRYVYIDHWYEFTSLKKAYSYEPIPAELQAQYHKNILGLETTMWSEWVPSLKRIEYQSFPRTCAYAEIGWSPKEGHNYQSFLNRLEKFLPRLAQLGVNYAPKSDWNPGKFGQLLSLATLALAPKKGW